VECVHPGARPADEAAATSRFRPGTAGRPARRVSLAGRCFAQVTALPVLLVMAWLLPGVALLLAGRLRPAPLVLISVPLAVIMIAAALRRVPGQRLVPALSAGRPEPARAWAGWWGLGGTLAVAAGFTAWQIKLNSPQLIVLRSPGAVFQVGYWIAGHGSLPISRSLAAFGGAHPGLTFASMGFAAAHGGIAPQFMPGLPILLAAGWWAGGMSAATLVSPVLGGAAMLSFGGLAGRLTGPQWAPPAALVLALTLPQQYTSRAAFIEPLVQVLLFGGLALVVDSLSMHRGPAWLASYPGRLRWPGWLSPGTAAAGLGGLAIGLTALAALASLPDLIPIIPFLGVAVVGQRPQVVPFGIGVFAGVGCGVAAGRLAAPGYLAAPGFSVRPASVIAAATALVTLLAVLAALWPPARGLAQRAGRAAARRWVPEVAAALVAAALIGFLIRPSVQTAHWRPGAATAGYVAALQRLLGLPLQPTRSYAEDSLYWVIWYIGVPALLLGGLGAALLTRRCVRALLSWRDDDGMARAWALPLAIIGWGTVSVLWYPGTVPDQPWASRTLVPLALPGFVLCAIWVAAWLDRRARERGAGLAAVSLSAACFAIALAVPTAVTAFGLTYSGNAPRHSVLPAATGLGAKQTGAGQAAAINGLCGVMSSRMSVVLVDRIAADEYTQVIRGMCKVPAAVMVRPSAAEVRAVLHSIAAHGRQPVLLATRPAELARYGTPRQVVGLHTTQEPHDLTQPPGAPWQISYVLWMSTTPAPGV
jgi:hypothetical protein